jgi:hypothetical protein
MVKYTKHEKEENDDKFDENEDVMMKFISQFAYQYFSKA